MNFISLLDFTNCAKLFSTGMILSRRIPNYRLHRWVTEDGIIHPLE